MTIKEAIDAGNRTELDRILMETPSMIDETIDGLWIPFYAAKQGNEDVIRYIVEYSRASFHVVDEKNRNILHYAVLSGNVAVVRYLTERVGMSPVKGDEDLITPFEMAHKLALEGNNKTGYAEIELFFEEYVGCRYDDMYHNPILTGMHPDPSIVRVGEDYYMVHSSFVLFPCIPISHSKDLIHWEVIGHAITRPEWAKLDELEGGRGYWAPDISYYNGRFTIAATYRMNDDGNVYRKQMITSSDKPQGPYEEPVFLDEDGIDPSIFTDDDGRRYVVLNRGARIFEISPDGKKQISKAELLFYGDYKRAPEGSHLLKKDGWYYLFEAEGGTGIGHRITVSRSRTLKGIYEPCPYNPIMRQEDEMGGIQRCGHGKPVMTQNGEWYMVYLCGRQLNHSYSMLGRETALDPIFWTSDGWPLVNMRKGPSCIQKKPNLMEWIPDHTMKNIWNEDGRESSIDCEWVSARPPEHGGIRVLGDTVILKGSKEALSVSGFRNLLIRRQNSFAFRLQASFEIPQMYNGQHAGIIGYYDENTYIRFGVEKVKEQYVFVAEEHIGHETKLLVDECKDARGLYIGQRVTLIMETKDLERRFLVLTEEGETREVFCFSNVYYLCDEGISMGKRFTGAMAGIYAYGGTEKELSVMFEAIKYDNM